MRLKHPDYIKLIIEAYNKKRAGNELSPLLAQSTPANIKRECANVYQERYEKKDEPMLRAFFGPEEHGRKFLAAIQGFDIDRFRPLNKYLKNPDENGISDRNLELLAWLIDFKYRPFVFGMEVILAEDERAVIERTTSKAEGGETDPGPIDKEEGKSDTNIGEENNPLPKGNDEDSIIDTKKPEVFSMPNPIGNPQKNTRKKAVIILSIPVILFLGTYFIWQHQKSGCMYWTGDHYEEVPCNEEPKGRLILPLNEEKMNGFRKITRKDTITDWSIGKVYYIKNNNTIEYYTGGGNHPVNITDTLKVLSRYMFEKYLSKKETPDKDSL